MSYSLQDPVYMRKMRASDWYSLMHMAIATSLNPRIGWNHAEKPLGKWLADMQQKYVWVRQDALEDALYCAVMAEEDGTYYHPLDRPLGALIRSVRKPNEIFDRDLNIFRPKKDDA